MSIVHEGRLIRERGAVRNARKRAGRLADNQRDRLADQGAGDMRRCLGHQRVGLGDRGPSFAAEAGVLRFGGQARGLADGVRYLIRC